MRTELVEDALRNAAATTVIEADAVFHSDRGSVYTSADYRKLVKALRMRSSMGRTGVWDNAMAESFFSALKNERVYRTVYATKAQARRDVIAYIEGFCNSRRLSALSAWLQAAQRGPLQLPAAGNGSVRNPIKSAVRNHRSSPNRQVA